VDYTLGHQGRSPLNILETIGQGAAFLDYDGDGQLDLLLIGPSQVRLYHNAGGRFTDVSRGAGLDLPGYWIGVAVGDYDNDGRPDLYLSGYHCGALLHNEAGARFRDVTQASGFAAEKGWGSSAAFVDLDQDGRLDLVVGHYVEFSRESRQFCEEDGRPVTCAPHVYPAERVTVYRSVAPGRFENATAALGFDHTAGRTLGIVPLDADGDGWTDLYLANDTEPGDLFRSVKGRRFENVGQASGTAVADTGRALGGMGLDAQDYDGDGRQDLLMSTFEEEPKCLWRNAGGGRFEEQSGSVGLDGMRPLVSWGAGLVDFDNDGRLDLLYASGHVVVGRVDPAHSYPQPLRLFRGKEGQFLDVSEQLPASLRRPFVGRGAAFGDYDGDGRVDVLVSNLEGAALLLHNEAPHAGHWLSVRLAGKQSNRMGLGARVTVEAGGHRWVAEAKTARSIFSASDPRVHFGLGAIQQLDRVTARWPSGRSSSVAAPAVDQTVVLTEPSE
jgi:hypothetical protein